MRSLTKCNRFVSSKIHWLNVSSQRRVLQGKRPSENRHTGTTFPDYFKSIIIGRNRFSLNSKYAHGFPFIKMVFRGPSWKYEHFLVASALVSCVLKTDTMLQFHFIYPYWIIFQIALFSCSVSIYQLKNVWIYLFVEYLLHDFVQFA